MSQLVYDRMGSRQVLMDALHKCSHRLVLVCPWLTRWGIDDTVHQRFEALLAQGRQIHVGWGHLKDIREVQNHSGSMRDRLMNRSSTYYGALDSLNSFEHRYHNRFQLKILGTHEKYLVCDRQFAMLGSHNFLTSGGQQEEREIGLYTTDPRLIEQLITRYDKAQDKEAA